MDGAQYKGPLKHSDVTLVCEDCWLSIDIMSYNASEVSPSVFAGGRLSVIAMTREHPLCSARDGSYGCWLVWQWQLQQLLLPVSTLTSYKAL